MREREGEPRLESEMEEVQLGEVAKRPG